MKKRNLIHILLLILLFYQLALAEITLPEEFLGFKPGTQRKLADMHQILKYFEMLNETSNRVQVEEVGKTTKKNSFIVAYISSEENLRNLEQYRDYQQ